MQHATTPPCPDLAIRPATPDDIGLILSLIRELAEYERLLHEAVATEESMREHLFGPRPVAEVLIASWQGQEAGFALFFRNFSTFMGRPGIYLEDVFVRPAFRGKGIGKALLARIAQLAVQRGCGRFEWAVLDWNEPSLAFYRSLGAVPMSEWTVQRLTGDALRALAAQADSSPTS